MQVMYITYLCTCRCVHRSTGIGCYYRDPVGGPLLHSSLTPSLDAQQTIQQRGQLCPHIQAWGRSTPVCLCPSLSLYTYAQRCLAIDTYQALIHVCQTNEFEHN